MSAWTNAKPNDPGYYWWKHSKVSKCRIVEVTMRKDVAVIGLASVDGYKGQWQGPLRPE